MSDTLRWFVVGLATIFFLTFVAALILAYFSVVDTHAHLSFFLNCSDFCSSIPGSTVVNYDDPYILAFLITNAVLTLGLLLLEMVILFTANSNVSVLNRFSVSVTRSPPHKAKNLCIASALVVSLTVFCAFAQFKHRSNDLLLLTSGLAFGISSFQYMTMSAIRE